MPEKICVFCNPDNRYVIADNDHCIATCFPDAVIKPGHFVVAVKDHVASLSRLSPEQASSLMSLAVELMKKAESLVGAQKYYMVAIADQVEHVHIHLLPKMPGDAPIGGHIMSDEGWKGLVGKSVPLCELNSFINAMR